MELREIAGNDKNLFSAEFKMRKKQQKLERQRQRDYEREKKKDRNNIFNFLNTTLNATSVESKCIYTYEYHNIYRVITEKLN